MEVIVAFDVGDRRIGVAVSDPFLSYATPSEAYHRTGKLREDAAALARIAKEKGASTVVLGLPLNRDGTESVQSEKTRRFARVLEEELGAPVLFEDERYTTRAAREDLFSDGRSTKREKKTGHVDSLAAAYILESYLEKRKRSIDMKEQREETYEDNIIEICDDEGNSYRYEHIMTFQYKKEWYVALTPAEPAEGEEDEVAIYRLTGPEDDERLETIEDEALLDEVFAEFCAQYEDFEDADEAAELEPEDEEE